MLIAFGITATFRPCLIEPAPALPDDEAPAAPVLLLEEEDELPHAASATAAASTGIQRMPLMRMGASPCRRSGKNGLVRGEPCGRRPVRLPAGPPRVDVFGGTQLSPRPPGRSPRPGACRR